MAKGLQLVCSDYDIAKEMIETGEPYEGLSYAEMVSRLCRWFLGEENLSFDEAVSATEDWLEECGIEFTHSAVVDNCKWCLDKKGNLKVKLTKLDKVEIYENEVQMIKQLPTAILQRGCFTMMVYCKLRKQRGLEPWNKIYHTFNNFCGYSGGHATTKDELVSLNWLQQNGYIDVPLDDLNSYYYTGVEGSGKVICEIDSRKLDRENFQKVYESLFVEKTKKIMVIDLMQEQGYVLKDSVKEVIEYLKEQGINVCRANVHKVLNHEKYMIGDYTLVEVQMENELWIRGAEILQRSFESCSKLAFKAIKPTTMRKVFIDTAMNMALQEEMGVEPDIKWFVRKADKNQRGLVSKLRH